MKVNTLIRNIRIVLAFCIYRSPRFAERLAQKTCGPFGTSFI